MYLIEYTEEDRHILKRYSSKEDLLETIKSYKSKGISFKVFYLVDLTDIFI